MRPPAAIGSSGERIALAAAVLLFVAVTLRTHAAPAPPTFTDVARESGIRFRNLSGAPEKNYIFEAKGGGVGLLDYDRDGFLDIFFTNGNTLEDLAKGVVHPNALYRANGDGTYMNVTQKAGVQGRGWAMGCAVGDYDNDGWPDLYVLGLSGNVLYRNNHDGTFSDSTRQSGLGDGLWCASAGFVDYDRDGDLDLYVARYSRFDPKSMKHKGESRFCDYRGLPVMCGPRGLEGEADGFFRNNGDGTFTDVSSAAGIVGRYKYYGLGVAVGDFDNDLWPDIYVANDSCPSFLFRNLRNGKFEDVGLTSGAALSADGAEQAGMGVDFGDYDNDGWLDITKTNFSNDYNNLYHNEHDGIFADVAREAGIARPSMQSVCWGTRFFDYDNDGWKDIFAAAGHVYPELIAKPVGDETYLQGRLLYRNLGNGRFADASRTSGTGIQQARSSRGSAFGDLDNDGDLDIVVANLDDVPSVLRNDGGNARNWLVINLNGTRTNRFGLGSRIAVRTPGLEQIGEPTTAGSVFSSNDSRVHFGLGDAETADIEVRWLSGAVQRFKAVPANRFVTIDEAQGLSVNPPGKP